MTTPRIESDDTRTLLKILLHRARVAGKLLALAKKIELMAHAHDLSKLTPEEFFGFRDIEASRQHGREAYGAEQYEAHAKGKTVELHLSRNTHHPECHAKGIAGMTFLDKLEMLIDWEVAHQERDTEADMDKVWAIRKQRFGLDDYQTRFLRDVWEGIEMEAG